MNQLPNKSLTTSQGNDPFASESMFQSQSINEIKPTRFRLRLLTVAGVSLILWGLSSVPSWGFIPISLGNLSLTNFDLDSLWQSVKTQLTSSWPDSLAQIFNSGNTGALGLPDRQSIINDIKKELGYKGWDKTHEFDRLMTDLLAERSLSINGQNQQEIEQQEIQTKIDLTSQAATAAQSEISTQNVLKHIATQNAHSTFILGSLQQNIAQLSQNQALSNSVLANISQTVDEERLQQQQQANARSNATLELLGYAKLYR